MVEAVTLAQHAQAEENCPAEGHSWVANVGIDSGRMVSTPSGTTVVLATLARILG